MNIDALMKIAAGNPADDAYAMANRAIDLVTPFIESHEGFRGGAYWDKIGKKWTVGHGHTHIPDPKTGKMRTVVRGDRIGRAASSALVKQRVRQNAAKLSGVEWTRTLSPGALAALYDVAYNAGTGALSASKSPSLNRKMNAKGANREAVVWSEIPTYRTSGGKVVRGLANRRADAVRTFRNSK